MSRYYEEYDGSDPHCTECGESCTPKQIDEGIGAYEYHGYKGVDVRLVWVSDCCEAEVEG